MISKELHKKLDETRYELYTKPADAKLWKKMADLMHDAKCFSSFVEYQRIAQKLDPSLESDPSALTHGMREKLKGDQLLEVIKDETARKLIDKSAKELSARKYDQAIATLSVKEMEPYYSTLINKGMAHHGLGQYERAIKNYEAALSKAKNKSLVHYNIATSLIKLEKFDQAIDHLRKAVHEHPEDADYQFQLGFALKSVGKWKQARPHFEQALLISPSYANAAYMAAVAIAQTNPDDTALILLGWAVHWQPSWKSFFKSDALLKPLHDLDGWSKVVA